MLLNFEKNVVVVVIIQAQDLDLKALQALLGPQDPQDPQGPQDL
jgi:prolyl-tRNA editing enzyme YbaK/EbsC (Cys-tRNA(Pro) deacylase)